MAIYVLTYVVDLAAKEKERVWLKRQTEGELDDMRLVEGLTGDKHVYKVKLEQFLLTIGHLRTETTSVAPTYPRTREGLKSNPNGLDSCST